MHNGELLFIARHQIVLVTSLTLDIHVNYGQAVTRASIDVKKSKLAISPSTYNAGRFSQLTSPAGPRQMQHFLFTLCAALDWLETMQTSLNATTV